MCFIISKLLGFSNFVIHDSTNPGMRKNSIYVIPLRDEDINVLKSIINDVNIPNKKLIVSYAK